MIAFTEWCEKHLHLHLTNGQRMLAQVCFDGLQPSALPPSQHPAALEMFGSLDDIPEAARATVVLRCGRGSGKSTLIAAVCDYALLTADLSSVGPGDIATVVVIAIDNEGAADTLNKARALVKQSTFAKAMTRDIANGFHIIRPDGRTVRFLSIAKSARGKAGRGKSIIQCIIDESEFVAPSDADKMIRDVDIISSITPRLIRGGKMILASTPWPAESETSRLFFANYGRATHALCALATTVVMRDHDPFWVNKRAAEWARDPANASREYDCIVGSAEGCWFDAADVDRAVDRTIQPLMSKACAGIDLGFRSDASAIVITERQEGRLVVVDLDLDMPAPGSPLVPSVIAQRYATKAKRWRCTELVADAHYIESAREAAQNVQMQVASGPSIVGDKTSSFVYLRDLLREGRLAIPHDERLIGQLKSILVLHQSGGGIKIIPPRKSGGGHCDLVSALVNAAWMDRAKFGPIAQPVGDRSMMPSFVKKRIEQGFVGGSVFGGVR